MIALQQSILILQDDDNDAIIIFYHDYKILFFFTSYGANIYTVCKILIIVKFYFEEDVGSGFLVLASRS